MTKPADKLQPIAPRLVDITGGAFYCGVGKQSFRDWVADGLIEPVPVPGCAIRQKGGHVVARPGRRRMVKLLFDVRDLDRFIDELKKNGGIVP